MAAKFKDMYPRSLAKEGKIDIYDKENTKDSYSILSFYYSICYRYYLYKIALKCI